MIEVWCDGGTEPINPGGVGTWGYIININNKRYTGDMGVVGEGHGISNNVSEYSAVIKALEFLIDRGLTKVMVTIYTDSQLVVNQLSGRWKAKKGHYIQYYNLAKLLTKEFKKLSFKWIPREQNKDADKLTRTAYENYCNEHGLEIKYMK